MLHEAEGLAQLQGHEVRKVDHYRLEGSTMALRIGGRWMRLPLLYQRANLGKHTGRAYDQRTRYCG
jgi:hypothetical protein